MKLNYDCIRDLMIFLEDNLSYENAYWISDIKIDGYSDEELIYTAEKLFEAGYINGNLSRTLSSRYPLILIREITWQGHELLGNIRDNTVWKKLKSKISNVTTSVSIPILNSVASAILSELLLK